jgi:peroxiredoxin
MPIVIDDGRLGNAFNLRVTPQHVIIGRDGRIQYVGNLADQRLEDALLAAKAAGGESAHVHKVSLRQDPARHGIGDRLPDFAVTTLDGASFNLRDSRAGHPTVLVFMSPWCESYLADSRPGIATSCRQVREQVDALAKEQPQLRWLGIASGIWATKDDLGEYQAKYKTALALTLDDSGQLFRSFRVMKVPTVLLADANGKIVARFAGFDAGLPARVRALSAP